MIYLIDKIHGNCRIVSSEVEMKIGKKLKEARVLKGLTQEEVAEQIKVSRQSVSNWENEKFFPDIISVIELSNLYEISLDNLLKGDQEMIEHLGRTTDIVKSNQKLIGAIIVNILMFILLILFNGLIVHNTYLIMASSSIGIISICFLFYQIVKKL